MSTEQTSRHLLVARLLSVGVLAGTLVLIFSRTMQRALDHDEHQFVASAALWAREGLLPYSDFPHFHMPYLVFVYGLLDVFTDQLFLAARIVSVLAAWSTVFLLHRALKKSVDVGRPFVRHGLACAGVFLLLFNPLFTYTSGLAWNHDLAVLLVLAAALIHTRGAGAPLLVGILVGFAVGVRLSVAPLAAPFLLSYRLNGPPGARLGPALRFLGGLTIALLPAGLLALAAPEQAVFDNLGYPALNTAYRIDEGFARAMDLTGKLQYIVTDVAGQPGNLMLLLLFFYGMTRPGHVRATIEGRRRQFVLLVIPFLLFGAFAPTPSWYQYFYALVPFAILGALVGLTPIPSTSRATPFAWVFVCLTVVAGAWQSLPDYRTLSNLTDPDSWAASRARRIGEQVVAASGDGVVLTLAPIYVVEAGGRIDPVFASGSFQWRSAPYLVAEDRARYGLVGPEELDAHLEGNPPAALLCGAEKRGEEPLRDWARRHGYVEQAVDGGLQLYVPPGGR